MPLVMPLTGSARRFRPATVRALLIACGLSLMPFGLAAGQEAARAEGKSTWPGKIYVATVFLEDPLSGLVAVDPNAGTWTKVATNRDPSARVSPDGKRLVGRDLGRRNPLPLELHTFDGEEAKEVFAGVALAGGWTGDGRHLFAAVLPPPGRAGFENWRIEADGAGREKLALPDTDLVQDASADGRLVLTLSTRRPPDAEAAPALSAGQFYLMKPDGTGERLLHPPAKSAEGLEIFATHPRLAPDGRRVVWAEMEFALVEGRRRPAVGRVVVINADGTGRRVLHEGREGEIFPTRACWSPDGRAIAGTANFGKFGPGEARPGVFVLDLATGAVKELPLPAASSAREVIDWR